jgi:nicotinamidase-related amidase
VNVVVDFRRYRERRFVPPLVFVDMHVEKLDPRAAFGGAQALAKCRLLLARARADGWPVAFVRPPRRAARGGETRSPRWIEGFEPQRADMVFDRTAHSCYASPEFADAMQAAGGVFVLAGFSGGSTCLPTLIDASRNGHRVGFVCDATLSDPLPGFDAGESHRAVTALASTFATIVTAEQWIKAAQTTCRAQEACHETAPNDW